MGGGFIASISAWSLNKPFRKRSKYDFVFLCPLEDQGFGQFSSAAQFSRPLINHNHLKNRYGLENTNLIW